jgi:hypothetical protein
MPSFAYGLEPTIGAGLMAAESAFHLSGARVDRAHSYPIIVRRCILGRPEIFTIMRQKAAEYAELGEDALPRHNRSAAPVTAILALATPPAAVVPKWASSYIHARVRLLIFCASLGALIEGN